MPRTSVPLDDDELDTILIVARNGQSGRITEFEIRELVRGYKADRDGRALHELSVNEAVSLGLLD